MRGNGTVSCQVLPDWGVLKRQVYFSIYWIFTRSGEGAHPLALPEVDTTNPPGGNFN
jgi:hypothetical protein